MKEMSVCCCTYNRPEMLGELIQSYLLQTYPAELRELIILDDAGQYGDVRGDGWQIVSFPRRFASLGEKRNACVSLTLHETEWIVIADDDDIYLPHWLEAHARNLAQDIPWSFASRVYVSHNKKIDTMWNYPNKGWLVQPTCAFSKKMFWRMGGYPHLAWQEDQFFFEKLKNADIVPVDALLENESPFLIFRRKETSGHHHATGMSLETYRTRFSETVSTATLEIGWKRDYLADVARYEKRHGDVDPC